MAHWAEDLLGLFNTREGLRRAVFAWLTVFALWGGLLWGATALGAFECGEVSRHSCGKGLVLFALSIVHFVPVMILGAAIKWRLCDDFLRALGGLWARARNRLKSRHDGSAARQGAPKRP